MVDGAKHAGETLGGVVGVVARGVPPGLGSYARWEDRLDGQLAQAVMAIQAVKAVAIGAGVETAALPGSLAHDPILLGRRGLRRGSNHAGGIEGGVSNGEEIVVRAYMKPIATLRDPLPSVDLATGEAARAALRALRRHRRAGVRRDRRGRGSRSCWRERCSPSSAATASERHAGGDRRVSQTPREARPGRVCCTVTDGGAMKIKRAAKYGFCSGVRVADIKVKRFARGGGRGAILGQVVHNERVVDEMAGLGVRTVKSMDEVTDGVIVFSAHGVPSSFHAGGAEARPRDPRHHLQVRLRHPPRVAGSARWRRAPRLHRRPRPPRGDRLHARPRSRPLPHRPHRARTRRPSTGRSTRRSRSSTRRRSTPRSTRTSCAPSRDANPRAVRADTICYATKENQDAARALASDPEVDLVLVVGGKHSANTRHLHDICARFKPSYLVQGVEDIDPAWLRGRRLRRPHGWRLDPRLRDRRGRAALARACGGPGRPNFEVS